MKYIITLIINVFISIGNLNAQSFNTISKSDTVYIMFDDFSNQVLKVGYGIYYEPDLPYPLDIGRHYFINVFNHCKDCKGLGKQFLQTSYLFTASPKDSTFSFYLEDKKEFFRKNYLDQRWFKNHEQKFIWDFLKNKIIMLVNPAYLYDHKYFVMRVRLITHVE